MPNSKNIFSSPLHAFSLVAIGVAITIAAGAVHGRLTQRWGPVPDMLAISQHLKSFPNQFGQWQLLSEEAIDERTLKMLSCTGHLHRQYVNRKSGQTVSIAIMLGPPGPISVHTPEICFSSRAYALDGPRSRVTISDREEKTNSFWSLTFRSSSPSTDRLKVYYAWRAKEVWNAAESPRFEFAGDRLLFKLQIAALTSPMSTDNAQDPCREFVSALLGSGWKVDG